MRTYRELFGVPEFRPLFSTVCAQIAATTVSGVALGTLVFAATHSPLLSALSMFGGSFAQVIGAATLLSAADRLPPRAAFCGLAVLFAVLTVVLAIPGIPAWAVFGAVLGQGLAASVSGGVKYGLLNEILPSEAYLLGRSVLNMAVGTMQICGFAAGGLLVTVLSPRGTLLAGAALHLTTAVVAITGFSPRPARASGRPSVAVTWRTNARLWSQPARRHVYLALWVPNGLIVGCESLYVAYAPHHAGLLLALAAMGMLAGDTLAGRFLPERRRERLGVYLRFLLAAPYLVFALHPPLFVAGVAVVLASVGYSASLLLQERLIALTPDDIQGQALGLCSSGVVAMQGVGAAVAGTIAQVVAPANAMAIVAVLSVAVTTYLVPRLRGPVRTEVPRSTTSGTGSPARPQQSVSAGRPE